MPLTPLAAATAEQLQDLVGVHVQRLEGGGCQILLGEAATAIIVPSRDSQSSSCVWSSAEFRLRDDGLPLPGELSDPARQHLPAHLLFDSGDDPLYLGKLERRRACSITSTLSGKQELWEVDMAIVPPLERHILDVVRPVAAPPAVPDLSWLDTLACDRAAALEEFIASWYGPPDPAAGLPPAVSARVPARLAALYRLAHGRPERHNRPVVLGTQNHIMGPDRLYTEPADGSLVFGWENQGCFEWSLDQYAEDGDPTIWTTEDVEPLAEPEPLSGFLIQFSLHEAGMSAPYCALLNRRPAREAQRLIERLRGVPLAPARWYGYDMDFYVAPGVIASGGQGKDGSYHFWLGASDRSALSELADLDVAWQFFDG
ncbi:hypothetical protein [Actinospica robiniae]|uniref:hypothetical protein n=1 Tax=Actinospica robiniae TaxID=304901 RepID=UPI00146FB636|nr:hypothetical protein [Actinospica robiniae]